MVATSIVGRVHLPHDAAASWVWVRIASACRDYWWRSVQRYGKSVTTQRATLLWISSGHRHQRDDWLTRMPVGLNHSRIASWRIHTMQSPNQQLLPTLIVRFQGEQAWCGRSWRSYCNESTRPGPGLMGGMHARPPCIQSRSRQGGSYMIL